MEGTDDGGLGCQRLRGLGRRALAAVDDPAVPPRLSKASGLTQEITVLPASGSEATSSSWRSTGRSSTTSASAHASAFAAPVTAPAPETPTSRSVTSAATGTAFSADRDPSTTECPWRAKR